MLAERSTEDVLAYYGISQGTVDCASCHADITCHACKGAGKILRYVEVKMCAHGEHVLSEEAMIETCSACDGWGSVGRSHTCRFVTITVTPY